MAVETPERTADELAIVSPEGTTVRFQLASLSERASAFMIDFTMTQVATALVAILAVIFAGTGHRAFALAVFVVASFFFRNVYFAISELYGSGQTFGKRKMGLRAISRDGGPLRGQAILARNVTRELEFFLPLVALSRPGELVALHERWAMPIACAWLAVFALFPILNRERLRCGDLLGGTVVVRVPQPALLLDLAGTEVPRRGAYTFTSAQLDVYGIAELQVLEQVIRRAGYAENPHLVEDVSRRIRRKIGWSGAGHVDHGAFLLAFYEAQRAHLERKLVFGVRKEAKSR